MTPRGGKRDGAGRPPILVDPVSVHVTFERAKLDALEHWAQLQGISRSAAVRECVEDKLTSCPPVETVAERRPA
jgi:hypothetical protein